MVRWDEIPKPNLLEHLIDRDGRKFFLTPIGKVLATQMEPLVRTMDVLDKNRKFWHEHDIGVLPHEILLNIGALGNYQIVEVQDEEGGPLGQQRVLQRDFAAEPWPAAELAGAETSR